MEAKVLEILEAGKVQFILPTAKFRAELYARGSKPGNVYRLNIRNGAQAHCACPDHIQRARNCKHLLAAATVRELMRQGQVSHPWVVKATQDFEALLREHGYKGSVGAFVKRHFSAK